MNTNYLRMADVNMLVDDLLLRELSAETRKIGTKVLVRKTEDMPAYVADIVDVIIVPQSEFYRIKFMTSYSSCNQNAVKALKELSRNFPFTPDYHLGIGYILNVRDLQSNLFNNIKIKGEIETIANAPDANINVGSTSEIISLKSAG